MSDVEEDWSHTVYKDSKEIVPPDAPEPLGNRVTLSSYFDANLMHDVLSGKAVTGILHFLNSFPLESYSKKQATVETATYGAEFVSGRTCFEQIIDLRNYLRYLGARLREKTYVFGDNETMINSSKFPFSQLKKRHHILTYHFVRSIIATKIINLHHCPSGANASDILSKNYAHGKCYRNIIKPLFFCEGDTSQCIDEWDIGIDQGE